MTDNSSHLLGSGGSFQWWTPIPWILAAVGITIAIIAFLRSRYPALKINHISAVGIHRAPDWNEIMNLFLRFTCIGSDLYDVKVVLECYYRAKRHRSYWPDVLVLKFNPKIELQNPIKNGQSCDFELDDTNLKEALQSNSDYYCIPSQLPNRRVSIAIYRSGDILVKRISSKHFKEELKIFDSLSEMYVRKGNDRFGWSHYYDQSRDR